MKNIVIITEGHFPQGDAGAARLLYMAKAMQLAGAAVTVLCRGKYGSGDIDGIRYVSLREKRPRLPAKLLAYLRFGHNAAAWLDAHRDTELVYLYHSVQPALLAYCKRKQAQGAFSLVYDCVEWFSPEQFRWGKRDIRYRKHDSTVTKRIDGSFRVIAISRYLEQYFSEKGIRALRVPMLCDAQAGDYKREPHSGQLRLFYAGTAQNKDLVGNLLEAALLLSPQERRKLRIDLVGPSRENLITKCGISPDALEACAGFLTLHGRVSRERVLEMMKAADFSVLFRDASLRYARAGFPSKVVESLANATPLLCNISSDLGEFLHDGENAVLADSHSPADIAAALRKTFELNPEQKAAMGENALGSAREYFDYRRYVPEIREFLEIE